MTQHEVIIHKHTEKLTLYTQSIALTMSDHAINVSFLIIHVQIITMLYFNVLT